MSGGELVSQVVECFLASDPDEVHTRGKAIGYFARPTYIVERGDGTRQTWMAELTRKAELIQDCGACGAPVCDGTCTPPPPPGPVGYVLARQTRDGRLVDDWDGEIHPTRATADAELPEANGTGPAQPHHYRVYELHPAVTR